MYPSRKPFSDNKLNRFKNQDENSPKISYFLPNFLTEKFEKEEKEDKSKIYFEENEEEGLNIEFDQFLICDNQNKTATSSMNKDFSSVEIEEDFSSFKIKNPHKSHSHKLVTAFDSDSKSNNNLFGNEINSFNDGCKSFNQYYPQQFTVNNNTLRNIKPDYQNHNNMKFNNGNIQRSNHGLNIQNDELNSQIFNQINYGQNFNYPMKNQQFENGYNFNGYNRKPNPNFINYPMNLNYNNYKINITQNFPFNPNGNMHTLNQNMNINEKQYVNNNYFNYDENIHINTKKQSNPSLVSHINEPRNFYDQNDRLNENTAFQFRPPPKKTFSDSNIRTNNIYVSEKNDKKSLFKEKDKLEEEYTIKEILANQNFLVHEYIKTQKGSRIMQKELNVISPEEIDALIDRISPHLYSVMIDTYGNYFSQKLIQSVSPNQRLKILKAISSDFVKISCHNSGTHSTQCLMEIVNLKEEEQEIKKSIEKDILTLSYDVNGTHVMQKIIVVINEQDREYINEVLLSNIMRLVFDPNGICVIKKLINGNKSCSIKKRILKEIEVNCIEIIQNPFGNYIIQHILDEWGTESCKSVTEMIRSNIVSLSMQKFSSNVVEKCLDMIDSDAKKIWIKDIFNFSKISSLLKSKYGNFVLQKCITLMSTSEKQEIKEYLLKKLSVISNKEKTRMKALIDILN